MKTASIILISIALGLMITSQFYWHGTNPLFWKAGLVTFFLLIGMAGYIIYLETNNQNRLLQIGIVLISFSLSFLKVKSDLKELSNHPSKTYFRKNKNEKTIQNRQSERQ